MRTHKKSKQNEVLIVFHASLYTNSFSGVLHIRLCSTYSPLFLTVQAAAEALNTLNKANLTELKSFGKPPPAVANVTAAVLVLTADASKIPKDRSWKTSKLMMSKVDQFLDSLITFDKENIQDANLKAVSPYIDDTEFDPDLVRTKSFAAAGLCSWVINIVMFYRVFCDVEPKRKALAAANAELAAAQDQLVKIKAKLKVYIRTYVHVL